MARTILPLLLPICILLLSSKTTSSSVSSSGALDGFLACLSADIPAGLIHTPATKSYDPLLMSSVRNLRTVSPGTTMPLAIVAATEPAHVRATVLCASRHGVPIRTRSGGHDYEGLSYASSSSVDGFALLDLAALRGIRIDAARAEAWVDSGASLGELYYAIGAANRTLGFPMGTCPTVGVGGHLSGGGYSVLGRKHGLSADNVVDAVVVDAEGRLLNNRSAMGEDLFWAIRGGGGESFGVVLSWKIRLVPVPETITVFGIRRSGKDHVVDLMTKWQEIAPNLPRDVYLRIKLENQQAIFEGVFQGRCGRIVRLMRHRFPDLGMTRLDCQETSWVRSAVYLAFNSTSEPLERLLDREYEQGLYYKVKSDHVQEPIPRHAWASIWEEWLEKPEAGLLLLDPYGGRMASIPPSATPFPHRKGNLYQMEYFSYCYQNQTQGWGKQMSWVRGLYEAMEPYVSKNPRAVYVNYRDLDLGTNELEGNVTTYAKAKVWGEKYFKGNFQRLAAVKARVDPHDIFRNEQSIPPLPAADQAWSSI